MASFEDRLIGAVKAKRERLGLSIRGLADVVGISFSSLARIERGEGQPDNNSKIRLLQWLGPDGEELGLGFDNVALVHFRAAKNIQSTTVRNLLEAADCLRQEMSEKCSSRFQEDNNQNGSDESVSLSKEDLEETATKFRADLGLRPDEPLDSLRVEVGDVTVVRIREANCLTPSISKELRGRASGEWSAMSVPLDPSNECWVVLLNDGHTIERQRVTILEEIWHILLGHKLTKIARIAEAYGRTYDETEEHDAYYLASATLLPKAAILEAVRNRVSSANIAERFGTSKELVDYRIKRLGLWREHSGKTIKLSPG